MIRFAPALLLLAACTPAAPVPAGPAAPLSIRYETSPCFGTCPVYTVSVDQSGKGTFTGTRFTAVTGERAFAVTPAQFDAFAAALAPLRPAGEALYQPGSALCPHAATDQTSVDVLWNDGRRADHLHYYFGCDMKDRSTAERLRAAASALPIAAFIGKR